MASPSVTYAFTNGTTADATQVNQNFTDLVNGLSDGTKDLSISALTAAGNVTLNGNTTLGNASSDDLTVTASLASTIPIKTTATYDIGSSTKGLSGLYLGNSTFTTKLATGATASWTFTLPATAGIAGQGLVNAGSGTMEWKYLTADTSAKSADYVVTDTDKIRTVLMTTGSTNRVVTLPTAADNAGRIITVTKIDSGTGYLTLKGEAAGETIDGRTGTTGKILQNRYESLTVQCDGSLWFILSQNFGQPKAFTPTTPNASFGTIGTSYMEYRRQGSNMHILGWFSAGTVATSEARLAIPDGLTIGTIASATPSYFIAGKWIRNNGSATSIKQGVVIATPTQAYLKFGADDYSNGYNPNAAQNAATLFNNTQEIYFSGEIVVPIAEWV